MLLGMSSDFQMEDFYESPTDVNYVTSLSLLNISIEACNRQFCKSVLGVLRWNMLCLYKLICGYTHNDL